MVQGVYFYLIPWDDDNDGNDHYYAHYKWHNKSYLNLHTSIILLKQYDVIWIIAERGNYICIIFFVSEEKWKNIQNIHAFLPLVVVVSLSSHNFNSLSSSP